MSTPAETISKAAADMHRRAAAATEDGASEVPWRTGYAASCGCCEIVTDAAGSQVLVTDDRLTAHIAGMHPGVARAVAEWLATTARDAEDARPAEDGTWDYTMCDSPPGVQDALKIARVYLREVTP